jgi:hypothetical protein
MFLFTGITPQISNSSMSDSQNNSSTETSTQSALALTQPTSISLATSLAKSRVTSRHPSQSLSLIPSIVFLFLLVIPCVFSSPLFSPSLSFSTSTLESTTTESPTESQDSDDWRIDNSNRDNNGDVTSTAENVYHAKPKWINPCGINSQALQKLTQQPFGGHYDVTPLTDGELLENVVLAARNALKHSRFFKEDYVSKQSITC